MKNCPINMNMNIDSASTLKQPAVELVLLRSNWCHTDSTGYYSNNRRNQLLYV